MKNTKKGISLIVLVITIIVMIILATAIILSINNSGIIGKANKAKTDSDRANLKEYLTVLEAEWEFMTDDEKLDYADKEAYVNSKFKEKGYKGALLMEDGTLYTNLNANAKAALEAGIKIGDRVEYTVPSRSETATYIDEIGTQEISNKTDFTWKFAGVSESGELMIVPEMVKESTSSQDIPTIGLTWKDGYNKGPGELNRLCEVLYSTDKGTARSMNIDDVIDILGYTRSAKSGKTLGDYRDEYIANGFPYWYIDGRYIDVVFPELSDDDLYSLELHGVTIQNNSKEITKEEGKDLVFQSTSYWLASNYYSFYTLPWKDDDNIIHGCVLTFGVQNVDRSWVRY